LCFMQTSNDQCVGIAEEHCFGACEKAEPFDAYNQRVLKAIASLTQRPSYVVLDKGLSDQELSCIMVVQGSFFGMGYLPKNIRDINRKAIEDYIQPYKENSFIRNLLNSFFTNNPDNVRLLPDHT